MGQILFIFISIDSSLFLNRNPSTTSTIQMVNLKSGPEKFPKKNHTYGQIYKQELIENTLSFFQAKHKLLPNIQETLLGLVKPETN